MALQGQNYFSLLKLNSTTYNEMYNRAVENMKRAKGETIVKPLKQSQKDMIKQARQLEKKTT